LTPHADYIFAAASQPPLFSRQPPRLTPLITDAIFAMAAYMLLIIAFADFRFLSISFLR